MKKPVPTRITNTKPIRTGLPQTTKKYTINLKLTLKDFSLSDYEKKYKVSTAVRCTEDLLVGSEKIKDFTWVKMPMESSPVFVDLSMEKMTNPDAKIFAEVFTRIGNSIGLPAPVGCGVAQIEVKELVDELIKNPKRLENCVIERDVVCTQACDETREAKKGKIMIQVLNPHDLLDLQFYPVRMEHVLEINSPYISNAINRHIEKEKNFFIQREPIVKEVGGIFHPYLGSDVPLPGHYFFLDMTKGRTVRDEESFIGNLLQTSLNRNNLTVDWFNEKCSLLFSNNCDDYSRLKLSKVLADTCTILPNSMYYASDHVYVGNDLVDIENFQNPIRFDAIDPKRASADCEDDANNIYNIATRIQRTDFDSETLRNLSTLSKLYVFCGTLASVQGAKLPNTEEDIPVCINDENEKNVPVGAHMCVTAIPHVKFVEMVTAGPKPNDVKNLSTQYYRKEWDIISTEMPFLALEGTGSMNPFIFPLHCYSKDKNISSQLRREHETKLNVQSYLTGSKETQFISTGVLQLSASRLEDKNDVYPKFLRYASQFYTDKFGRPDTFFPSDGKVRGISIRSLFLTDNKHVNISNERYYKKPTLEMLQRAPDQDEKIFMRLKSQMPPYPHQKITESNVKKIGSSVSDTGVNRIDSLYEFNSKCAEYTNGRTCKESIDVHMSYKHDMLFDMRHEGTSLIDKIASEIKNSKRIIGAKAKMVVLSDRSHIMDVKFTVATM